MTKRLPEFASFREWCIGEIALMFGYVDPIDRKAMTWGQTNVEVGQLVTICSAPNSIWGFSWVEEVGSHAYDEYCLRAVGTDQLCNWTNVALAPFLRDRYEDRDDLKWWPNQYDFWVKLQKAYIKAKIDQYDFSLAYPKFLDEKTAEVRFRCHIFRGEQQPPNPIEIQGFEKATVKFLQESILRVDQEWKATR